LVFRQHTGLVCWHGKQEVEAEVSGIEESMRHGSLFSGIGGFDLAAEWMGWENVFHCEWNEFGKKVLNYYWPNAISYGDIKTLTLENIWQDYVQSVKKQIVHQADHTANHATQNECEFGEKKTEIGQDQTQENGTEERKKKSLIITEDVVHAVENLKWNFSQLTIRKIMAMKSEGNINLRHGNLLLNVDFLMTTKSSATIATMQKLITEFVHIIENHAVDIITGGVPCQPASTAGKRKGKEDDRWLWPEAIRVIRIFQPTWFIFENVRGLISLDGGLAFDTLLSDLEAEGYEVTPFLLPACAVNAPHRRDRIWFVANRNGSGFQKEGAKQQTTGTEQYGKLHRTSTDSSCTGLNRDKELEKGCNAKRNGISFNEFNALHESGIITDTESQRYEPFNPDRTAVIPTPTKQGLHGRSSNSIHQSTKWQEFPTQSPICNGDDGLSSRLDGITFPKWRNESIKAGGNAIVPQVAFEIFKAIQRTL